MKRSRIRGLAAVALAVLLLGGVGVGQAGQGGKGPLKVFILAGQSNMEGHGVIKGRPEQKGTLETLSRDPASAARYKHLLDEDGKWAVRTVASVLMECLL